MNERDSEDLCHNLAARRHARGSTRFYDSFLSRAGLASSQFSIMAMIEAQDGITIADLAAKMVMERTTLLRALTRLEGLGWAERGRTGSGRTIALSLTPMGRAKLDEARPHWLAAQRAFELSVGLERASELRGQLQAVGTDN